MPEPISILLVDDHADTNRSLMLLLGRRGYRVESALDVAEALKLAEQHAFDLLISDMSLPDGSGLDLLKKMGGRSPRYGGIIISGYGMDDDVSRSAAAGYKAHLTKPVDVQRLDGIIQRIVQAAGSAT